MFRVRFFKLSGYAASVGGDSRKFQRGKHVGRALIAHRARKHDERVQIVKHKTLVDFVRAFRAEVSGETGA